MTPLFLVPGGYYFGLPSQRIVTLLGSCIALVAWHPMKHLTLVSHVVLPCAPAVGSDDTRYGDVMLARWLQDLRKVGVFPDEFRLALFGGSSRLYDSRGFSRSVGYRNIEWMRETLANLGLPLLQQDCGGDQYRKLVVDGTCGQYEVQLLGVTEPPI